MSTDTDATGTIDSLRAAAKDFADRVRQLEAISATQQADIAAAHAARKAAERERDEAKADRDSARAEATTAQQHRDEALALACAANDIAAAAQRQLLALSETSEERTS
jgi:hypothetical protein